MEQHKSEPLFLQARELIDLRHDGKTVVEGLTRSVDNLLATAYESSLSPSAPLPRLALVAVGGYGRREIAPYSDVDIMLLAENRGSINTETAQSLLYRLWDMGLTISHSFRTLSECVDDALGDVKTRTSLIDSRFVAGNEKVFAEFRREVYPKLLYKGKRNFVADILRDIDMRHRTFGDSLLLLEPNVKEGRGGLRDIHSLSWLAQVELKSKEPGELGKILGEPDYRHLMRAHDFLLRVRVCLHSPVRPRNDTLSFEVQDEVARMLRLKDIRGFLAAEILMRLYYRKAANVTKALGKVTTLCGRRYFRLPASFGSRKITDDFYLSRNEIVVRDRSTMRDADKILEACAISAATGKKFSQQLRDLLSVPPFPLKGKLKVTRKAARHFIEILKSERVYETLREMHDTVVLDRFIPEFGRLRHLVIYEPYHRYTVDEHSLMAIRNLESVKLTKQVKLQYLAEMLKTVRQEVLFFAVLLHDVGKGFSERHDEIGYRLIKDILERFELRREDRRMVEFLVKNHISLSKLALTRDPDSPETTAQIAELVEGEENLNALYLMTYADMTAVNPRFWTEWKAYLFHDLYKKTRDHLRGIGSDYFETSDADLKLFVEDMPRRYLLSQTTDSIVGDYGRAREARATGLDVSVAERDDGTSEITVITQDSRGLFSRIVGVLSSRGLNVLRARLFTGKTGLVVDKILLSNWRDLWWEGLTEKIREDLWRAVMEIEERPVQLPGEPTYPPILSPTHEKRLERFFEIDNEVSENATILEVVLPDRIGLLYDLSRRLYLNNIDIISAVINTEEGIARDVFYLRNRGGKLDCESVLGLLNSISLPDATSQPLLSTLPARGER